jgi:hypothetical protein
MFKKLFTTKPDQKRELIDPHNLQLFLGFCGILLPVLCYLIAKTVMNMPLQISISAYYYSVSQDVFVGILCILAACFIAYRGYNKGEQFLGKLMGVLALGTAFFPTEYIAYPEKKVGMFQLKSSASSVIHIITASLLFILLGVFSFFFFTKSDKDKKGRSRGKKIQNLCYRICGIAIWGCGIMVFIAKVFLSEEWVDNYKIVFWMEAVMVWAFGLSWIVKSKR